MLREHLRMGGVTMHIGIFGGAFDPPHIAHTLSCLYAIETSDIEQIWVMPCFKHPFEKNLSDFPLRIMMCTIAMRPLKDNVIVSEEEAELGDISYTIDTIRALIDRYPEHIFSLIIGSDILLETDTWKEFDHIERLVNIVEIPRPLKNAPNNHHTFYMPDISSTMIRNDIRAGKDVSAFLSRGVYDFIKKHKLYQ